MSKFHDFRHHCANLSLQISKKHFATFDLLDEACANCVTHLLFNPNLVQLAALSQNGDAFSLMQYRSLTQFDPLFIQVLLTCLSQNGLYLFSFKYRSLRIGSYLFSFKVQVRFRLGLGQVQVRFRLGLGLGQVQFRFRLGLGLG